MSVRYLSFDCPGVVLIAMPADSLVAGYSSPLPGVKCGGA
jgi:hypothetical protein